MKTYTGRRTIDGLEVLVDDQPLDLRLDIHVYEPLGFEWSYEGDAPRQLALAILADHLDDPNAAMRGVEDFMARVIANLDNEWYLTSTDIDDALSNPGPV